jgi:nitrogen fixation protein FixH
MKKIIEKINNWWASQSARNRSIITIVSTCTGLVLAFFGIIIAVNLMN